MTARTALYLAIGVLAAATAAHGHPALDSDYSDYSVIPEGSESDYEYEPALEPAVDAAVGEVMESSYVEDGSDAQGNNPSAGADGRPQLK